MLLFTDGITEASRGGDARAGLFGLAPLTSLLQRHARAPLAQLKQELLEELDRFTGAVYEDDVSFLVLRARDAA
jgi:serine phosphatase RsbU (regulator of sigma subunit)